MRRGQRRHDANVSALSFARLSPWVAIAGVAVALLLAYVWQMTLLATVGYERGALERRRTALEDRTASLHVEALDEQALARVESRVKENRFILDTAPVYVTAAELARTVSRR